MNNGHKTIVAMLAVVALSTGCATKRYGRLMPLSPLEAQELACSQIRIELDKVDEFVRTVTEQAQFSGADVFAALGDFGIGNAMERDAALKSAKARREELLELQYQRCGVKRPPREPETRRSGRYGM